MNDNNNTTYYPLTTNYSRELDGYTADRLSCMSYYRIELIQHRIEQIDIEMRYITMYSSIYDADADIINATMRSIVNLRLRIENELKTR